jgi:hypothetical protein
MATQHHQKPMEADLLRPLGLGIALLGFLLLVTLKKLKCMLTVVQPLLITLSKTQLPLYEICQPRRLILVGSDTWEVFGILMGRFLMSVFGDAHSLPRKWGTIAPILVTSQMVQTFLVGGLLMTPITILQEMETPSVLSIVRYLLVTGPLSVTLLPPQSPHQPQLR